MDMDRTEEEDRELQELQDECPTAPAYYSIDETWEYQRPEAERLNDGLRIMFGK